MSEPVRSLAVPAGSWLARLSDRSWVRWLLMGAGAVVALGVVLAVGWAWWSAQEAQAREALTRALVLLEESRLPGASSDTRSRAEQAFEQVLSQHARSSVAPEAAYRLGNLRHDAGQYAAARGAFEVAIAKGASATTRTMSAIGIAYTWEAESNLIRAQGALEATLAGRSSKDFLYEETLMDLARVQERGGNREAAVETYRRILREMPASRRADDIRSRIADLESRPKS